MTGKKKIRLLNNSRFYILVLSLLLSVAVASYLRLQLSNDQLYYIRLQQVFGLLAVSYWYLALIISPMGYIIGKHRTKHITFARRAIGVSAAYFALLHGLIALWGQLGGVDTISLLPPLFQWSLMGGALAFIILVAMAATSLDAVITFMTFKRWKWLHRLVYIGGIAAILHIWTIGTHLAYANVQWVAFCALAILGGLEAFRATALYANKYHSIRRKDYFFMVCTSIWIGWLLAISSMPLLVQNYHARHIDRNPQSPSYGKHHE